MKKFFALLLSVLMLVGVMPLSAFAANDYTINSTTSTDDYYNLVSKKDWDIAPGITESEIVLNNDAGDRRQVMHIVEVDMNNEYTKVIPSYKGMIPTEGSYGVQTMDLQAAYAEANGYGNVVAAMNLSLSWYNSDYYAQNPDLIGEPLGYMILDGVQYTNSQGQSGGAQTCLVINFDEKDGEARPSDIPKVQVRSTSDAITGWEEQVIPANFGFVVKDGQLVTTTEDHTSEGAPRSMVGIKEDGTIVMVMNDGRQSPYSSGFNSYEMGEAMLNLGCVYAINGDGGGSSQFLSQRPGEELEVHCSPSDGALRATTHGILVISTAPADGEFYKAHISADNSYYTPGSNVQFEAIGTDMAGTEVDIPEDAVWQLSDSSLGTIDQNGLFVSNGEEGEVTVQLVCDGTVVGEDTIYVVVPNKLAFSQATITVPYGKTVTLNVSASYNSYAVVVKDEDIVLSLSEDAIGTLNGFEFTACEAETGINGGTVTATFANTDVFCTANLSLGKASVVVDDFEDGDISNWNWDYNLTNENKFNIKRNDYVVTSETGQVHSGDKAMALELDFTNVCGFTFAKNWLFSKTEVYYPVEEGATGIGFWFYIPELEELGRSGGIWRITVTNTTTNASVTDAAINSDASDGLSYNGWRYYYIDISSLNASGELRLYMNVGIRCDPSDSETISAHGKFTWYFDDVTVDYSTVVEDREAPVFESIGVVYNGVDAAVEMNGATIGTNDVSFVAKVADAETRTEYWHGNKTPTASNYTGINISSAKFYIDGVQLADGVTCTSEGLMSINNVVLPNGPHTVRFEICDNNGNKSYIEDYVVINGNSTDDTVSLVPADPDADMLPIGSLYWMNIETSAIEKIEKITTVLNLNSLNTWELDHMEVADGFEATYDIDELTNNATVTITKTGKVSDSGSAVIAKLPIRTWESALVKAGTHTAEALWSSKCLGPVDIKLSANLGAVTYSDGSVGTFSMEPIEVLTEIYSNYAGMEDDWSNNTSWHQHTAEAMDDCAATCTRNGYTGRTYCEVCDSVVDWGETIPATGHNYKLVDGVYVCEDCGDENGTVNGLVKDGDVYRYFIDGVAQSGWIMIDADWYYFNSDTTAKAGKYSVDGIEYEFEETGKLVSGVWAKTLYGTRYFYGPGCYGTGWYEIDGNRYYFQNTYRYEGYRMIFKAKIRRWYNFGDDGICREDEVINGFYWDADKGLGYVVDNVGVDGLHKIDGDYYFFNYYGYAVSGFTNVGSTYCDMPTGNYYFGEDYKAVTGLVEKNGVIYYYENGRAKMAGLVEIDGDIYFAGGAAGEITVGKKIYVWNGNGILPEATYEFGADGKILNGIVEKDGTLYYYKNGQPRSAGLVEVDGDYYFAGGANGEITVNKAQFVWDGNNILPEATYEFGADGKMLKGIVEKDGVLYYYENGQPKMAGLVEIDGDYYFAGGANGEVTVNKVTYVWKDNGIALENANCEFGADGKMLNGIVEKDGVLYYYVMGRPKMAGLINIDGDYYFAGGAKGEITVNKVTYVWKDNGIALDNANCEFGADGKMLNGIVEKDGVLYYYVMGRPRMAGLVEVDGALYFAGGANGEVTVGKKTYVWKANGILPEATYEFGADGKMLNGIIEKDGTLYYYSNGKAELAGLVEVDGAYYFVSGVNGEITVNKKQYVWDGNGLLPEDNYEFGADGKMLDGFVTKDDGIYYYEDGKPGRVGLNYIDGYYYFVDYSGKLFTSGTYFVWETNGYTIGMKYTFDDLGRLILK